MDTTQKFTIVELQEKDCETLAHTFNFPWSSENESKAKWKRYHMEQESGSRKVLICKKDSVFIGYGSILIHSKYPNFRKSRIPEINDVWIDSSYRGQGYGKALIEHLEKVAGNLGFAEVGIGVGLYEDYGTAQALYCKLGYIPDGKGITYDCEPVTPGVKYSVDDNLILWFTKKLSRIV